MTLTTGKLIPINELEFVCCDQPQWVQMFDRGCSIGGNIWCIFINYLTTFFSRQKSKYSKTHVSELDRKNSKREVITIHL